MKSHAKFCLICVNSSKDAVVQGIYTIKDGTGNTRHNWLRTGWHKMRMKIKSTNQQSAAQGKLIPALKSCSVGNKKSHWAENKPSENITHPQGRWSGWTMMSSGDVDSITDGDWNLEDKTSISATSSHCHQPDQEVNFTHGQHLLQNQQHHLRLSHPALE